LEPLGGVGRKFRRRTPSLKLDEIVTETPGVNGTLGERKRTCQRHRGENGGHKGKKKTPAGGRGRGAGDLI